MSRLHVEAEADTTAAADTGSVVRMDFMPVAATLELEANVQAITVPSGRVALIRTGGMEEDGTAPGMVPD
jgi:hypothetical protein